MDQAAVVAVQMNLADTLPKHSSTTPKECMCGMDDTAYSDHF